MEPELSTLPEPSIQPEPSTQPESSTQPEPSTEPEPPTITKFQDIGAHHKNSAWIMNIHARSSSPDSSRHASPCIFQRQSQKTSIVKKKR